MQSFEQYNKICKYFNEGKQKDNEANEAHLSVGKYLTDKYAKRLNFRRIDENALHGTGRRIENGLEGIILQVKEKAELAGALKMYIYLIMDTQLNIKNGAFHSIKYIRKMLTMLGPHMALFVALTGVGRTHLALDLLEQEYFNHFDFIVIICTTLRYNEAHTSRKWV